jgi:cytochrome c
MDFLKNMAIPQSYEHFQLVVFIAAISSLVFLPYVGFVLGSSILSYRYNRKGRSEKNPLFLRLAHSFIDIALYNKSLITFLAIIPGLSIVLSYAQMLQQTPSIAVSLAGSGFVFLAAGFALLYSYKYTFRVGEVLEAYQKLLGKRESGDEIASEIGSYERSNEQAHFRTGRWGIFFLSVSAFLYLAAAEIIIDPENWTAIDSVLSLLLSWETWLALVRALAIFAGITGLGMLYFSFAAKTQRRPAEEYAAIVRQLGTRLTVISLLVLPIPVYISIASIPASAASGYTYGLAGAAILFLFLSAHFVYGYGKSNTPGFITGGLAAFVLATWFLVTNDYTAVGTSARDHAALLAAQDEQAIKDMQTKLGISVVTFTGADIYQTRCSSCHLFDVKKVGPPYYQTVPKYKGNKEDLMAFVLNPTLKDPGYPPMPNPGLKPAEADSIAAYLIRTVTAHYAKIDTGGTASSK